MICCGCVAVFGCAPFRSHDNVTRHVDPPRHLAEAQRRTREGVVAVRAGDLDGAAQAFDAAIRSDPTFGRAHNNRGLVHLHRDEIDLAIDSFERAMEFLPGDPRVIYNLAVALESAGKRHDAADLYRRAAESEPTNPVYLASLVRVRARLGDESPASREQPAIRDQLEKLLVIETRPRWRRWAEEQLAWSPAPGSVRVPGTSDDGRDVETIVSESESRGGMARAASKANTGGEAYAGVQVIELAPRGEMLEPMVRDSLPELIPDRILDRGVVPAVAFGPRAATPPPYVARFDAAGPEETPGIMIPASNVEGTAGSSTGAAPTQNPPRFRIPETIGRLHFETDRSAPAIR